MFGNAIAFILDSRRAVFTLCVLVFMNIRSVKASATVRVISLSMFSIQLCVSVSRTRFASQVLLITSRLAVRKMDAPKNSSFVCPSAQQHDGAEIETSFNHSCVHDSLGRRLCCRDFS